MSASVPHDHFEKLRLRINKRLGEVEAPYAREQIDRYPWLYGALGGASAEVAFVCENPSMAGVRKAKPPLGGPCDFDTQWTGDPAFRRDKRFRTVLCDLGLKDGGIWERGGWNCYITNVIKAMDVVRDFNQRSAKAKAELARQWADILCWELSQVDPKVVFCVGRKSERVVSFLQKEGLIRYEGPLHYVLHYSARGASAEVEREMRRSIESGCDKAGIRPGGGRRWGGRPRRSSPARRRGPPREPGSSPSGGRREIRGPAAAPRRPPRAP